MEAGTRRPQLLYAAVLSGSGIMADSQVDQEQLQLRETVSECISRIPSFSGFRRYLLDCGRVFDCYRDPAHGLDFACLADAAVRLEFARAFLEALRSLFGQEHQEAEASAAGPYSLQGTFGPRISSLMATYNRPDADRVQAIQEKVEALREDVAEAVDRLLLRGDAIQTLQDRSRLLGDTAVQFRTEAYAARRRLRWRRILCPLGTIAVVLLLCLAIFWASCGITFEHC